jgi:hypothetical protein
MLFSILSSNEASIWTKVKSPFFVLIISATAAAAAGSSTDASI